MEAIRGWVWIFSGIAQWDNLQAWNNLTMERSDCNLNVTVLY